jgi:hypothetical protein
MAARVVESHKARAAALLTADLQGYPILTFPEVRTSSSTSLTAAERGSLGRR